MRKMAPPHIANIHINVVIYSSAIQIIRLQYRTFKKRGDIAHRKLDLPFSNSKGHNARHVQEEIASH
jgi:hypothetical protein